MALASGGTTWNNIDNLLAVGAVGAQNISYTTDWNNYSQLIEGTNIQWKDSGGNPMTFPANAVISGIQMVVTAAQTAGTSAVYGSFWLLGIPGTVERQNGPWANPATQTFTFGTSTDWWGAPQITPAMLNAPGFGWALRTQNTQLPGNGCDTTVYSVTLKVWYVAAAIPVIFSGSRGDWAGCLNVWGAGTPPTPPSPPVAPTLVQTIAVIFNGTTATLGIAPTPGNTLVGLIIVANSAITSITNPTGTTAIATGSDNDGFGTVYSYSTFSRAVQAGDSASWTFTKGSGGTYIMYVAELTGSVTGFSWKFGSNVTGSGVTASTVDISSKSFVVSGTNYVIDTILYWKNGDVSYVVGVSPSWISYAGGGGNVALTSQIAFGVSPASYSGFVDIQVHNAYNPRITGGILLLCWS
jgi:hypothetical protein